MLILTGDDVRRALPMAAAMDAVERAFAQLAAGQAEVPLRPHVTVPEADGLLLVMPAYLSESGALAVKALTIFPHNSECHGLPAIAALVTLFDATNGVPLALLDASYLTALRTGAASGVATRLLARRDARTLALFGAGAQALPQAWAVCVARQIARIWLVNRTGAHAERLAAELRAFGEPIPADVRIAASAHEALAEADVICTATASSVPLFADGDVRPGAHLNAIGAYRPAMREIPGETVARARVVVDARAAAWAEAGELVLARDEGLIGADHVAAELGEIALGRATGRTDPDQITLFKSVGNAAQDAAAAQAAYARARALGIGTAMEL
jgi:ornithine cyclodeaminase/alanine dehydrogenase-like protein (mu-crystallin family)